MEMIFARTGGFAGLATAVDGKVTFFGALARVTSGSGYRRELGQEESRELRGAIKQVFQDRPGAPGQLRDAFQYDIRIIAEDGRTLSITIYGRTQSEDEYLCDWVRQECDRIWAARTGQCR